MAAVAHGPARWGGGDPGGEWFDWDRSGSRMVWHAVDGWSVVVVA